MNTTIQVNKELSRRWKVIAAMRDMTYEALLREMDDLYCGAMPFRCEEEFTDWLTQPRILATLGFAKVKQRRKTHSPDLVLIDIDGKEERVEVELLDKNFLRHHHNPQAVDLIIAAYGTEDSISGVPVFYFNTVAQITRVALEEKYIPPQIKTYGTLSGYIYLHIPKYVCRQFDIKPSTIFTAIYRDGKLILEQDKEDRHAT